MLQIVNLISSVVVFVVDRFYSSTCSYTIGKETSGTAEDIDNLLDKNPSLVNWPKDLLLPDICIILKIGKQL